MPLGYTFTAYNKTHDYSKSNDPGSMLVNGLLEGDYELSLVDVNGVGYNESYAQKPICGVSETGFCVWGYDGKAVLDAYNIAKVIPKHQATKEQDLEFRLKSLELENSMLRSMLRKEG